MFSLQKVLNMFLVRFLVFEAIYVRGVDFTCNNTDVKYVFVEEISSMISQGIIFQEEEKRTKSRNISKVDEIFNDVIWKAQSPISIYSEENEVIPVVKQRKNKNVNSISIFLRTCAYFKHFIEVIRSWRVVYYDTKVIVIVDGAGHGEESILKLLWNELRLFHVVVVDVSKNGFLMSSWNPYHHEELVRKWCYNASNRNLFQERLPNNFHGFPLKILHMLAPPSVLPPDENGHFFQGTDVFLRNSFANYYNFTIVDVPRPMGLHPWRLVVNGTLYGFFRMLNDHSADWLCGGILLHLERFTYADPLFPYGDDKLVWLAPRLTNKSTWLFLTGALSPLVWMLVILSMFCIILVTIPKKWDQKLNFLFIVTSAILQAPLSPNDLKPRLNFIILIWFTFIIATLYSAGLFTLLTAPREPKQIETLQEAFDMGMHFLFVRIEFGSKSLKPDFWNNPPNRFTDSLDWSSSINKVALEKQAVFKSIKSITDYLLIKHQVLHTESSQKPVVRYLHVDQDQYKLTTFVSPGHPLGALMGVHVSRLIEGGLVAYIHDTIMHNVTLEAVAYPIREIVAEVENLKPLGLDQLAPLFYLLLSLSVFSVVIFICELILYKTSKAGTGRKDTRS